MELVPDHRQIVIQRLHVGVELVRDISGQKSKVTIRQGNHRPGEQDLPILLAALQGRRQGQQGLAGPGRAGERDQLDLVIEQRIEVRMPLARGRLLSAAGAARGEGGPIACVDRLRVWTDCANCGNWEWAVEGVRIRWPCG